MTAITLFEISVEFSPYLWVLNEFWQLRQVAVYVCVCVWGMQVLICPMY